MAKIETWFPCSIYYDNDVFSLEQNKKWETYCLNLEQQHESGGDAWYGDTYTSLNQYDLRRDPIFQPLVEEVLKRVHEFAREFNCTGDYNCKTAWFNVNRENTFQEFHTHAGGIFSAIYYVSAPEGSGSVVFEDPKEPDMLPLKGVGRRNELSYIVTKYPPATGKLIIFRSYMRHLVESGTNTDPRISIALNFN